MLFAIMTMEFLFVYPLVAFSSVSLALLMSVLSVGTGRWPLWSALFFERLPVALKASRG